MHVSPLGVVVKARHGETIMAAALALGYYWPTSCQMQATCATCVVTILQGAENLSPMERAERTCLLNQRGPAALSQPVRLACQAKVLGDVEVRKYGVQPPLPGA
ncbi:MAG: (2Fe-2S)-binding protein [Chloroflexi bacterium]|nr:(2Fe-2S)-binding protein [Chloroflexota bacterium]